MEGAGPWRSFPQSVAIDLRETDGAASLDAFSLGKPYTIDPHKLSFTARRYGDRHAPRRPLIVRIGTPRSVASHNAHPERSLRVYEMSVDFPQQPGQPGMYDVVLTAAPGFARADDGSTLPFGDWSHPPSAWHAFVWWPDTRDGDASLHDAQRRFAGRDVFGYGGIVVGCPHQFNTYGADTAVRVRQVVRDTGPIEELWTGTTSYRDEMAPHFFAISPLRLLLEKPSAEPLSSGGSSGTSTERCPALVLADWQLDVTLSLTAPPPMPKLSGIYPQIRKGITKNEVAWRFGYPRTFDDLARFRRADRWVYDGSPFSSFWIAFHNGRAVTFSQPREMP
ncbi:MAG TPA: hypothetical protein VGF18_04460 [Candidatus Tumulicola sp.]|jgi:hypothetical protein